MGEYKNIYNMNIKTYTLLLFISTSIFSCNFIKKEPALPFLKNNVSFQTKDKLTGWSIIQLKEPVKKGVISNDSIIKVPFEYDQINFFNNEGFSIVTKGRKRGVIDTTGHTIIPLEYDYIAHPRIDGSKGVRLDNPKRGYLNKTPFFIARKDTQVFLLNKDAKRIASTINIKTVIWDFIKVNNKITGIFIIKNTSNQIGVINEKGEILIPFNYQKMKRFDGSDRIIAMRGNKYGVINFKNEIVLPFEYQDLSTVRGFNYYVVKTKNKLGLIDKKGKQIMPPIYDYLMPCHHDINNRFIVEKNSLKGIINIDQKAIIPIEHDFLISKEDYSPDGHVAFRKGKQGIFSPNGDIIIPFEYDYLRYYSDNFILVRKGMGVGLIDINNNVVLEIKYDEVFLNWLDVRLKEEKPKEVYVKIDDNYFLIDFSGKIIQSDFTRECILEELHLSE